MAQASQAVMCMPLMEVAEMGKSCLLPLQHTYQTLLAQSHSSLQLYRVHCSCGSHDYQALVVAQQAETSSTQRACSAVTVPRVMAQLLWMCRRAVGSLAAAASLLTPCWMLLLLHLPKQASS